MCAQSVPKTNTKTIKRHGKGTFELHQQPTIKTFNAHANAVVLEAVPWHYIQRHVFRNSSQIQMLDGNEDRERRQRTKTVSKVD